MVRGKGSVTPSPVLSDNERSSIQDEIQEIDNTLAAHGKDSFGEGGPGAGLNVGALEAEKRRLEKALDNGTPRGLTEKRRDDLVREGKRIAEMIVVGLPTRFEMDNPAKVPGAIRKHQRWELENRERLARYREIRRLIQDDDVLPHFEQMRKEK